LPTTIFLNLPSVIRGPNGLLKRGDLISFTYLGSSAMMFSFILNLRQLSSLNTIYRFRLIFLDIMRGESHSILVFFAFIGTGGSMERRLFDSSMVFEFYFGKGLIAKGSFLKN
jgi:hypothetical protein